MVERQPLGYPRVREATFCPLCLGTKDEGVVACRLCYRSFGLRYGNLDAERVIEEAERALEAAS